MSSESALPTTQKAWMVVTQGKPRDALVLKTDVPVPKPKRGEVLVRVRAAALNPVGWKIMSALPNALSKRPHPAELDFSGVIANANGTSLSDGDEVFGYIPIPFQFSSRQGSLAQYIALPEDYVTRKPTKLTWEESAALPLTALTALQSLRLGGYEPARALQMTPASPPSADSQESIFIHGGSTSVGIYAIQLAKALSLRVTASASARNESFVHGVGADVFLDYTTKPIAEQLSADPPDPRFGMVLDAAGSSDTALYVKSREYVKKGGSYVTTGPWPEQGGQGWLCLLGGWTRALLRPALLGGVPTGWKMVGVENKKEDMEILCSLIERGALRPYVDSTYEFGSVLEAYDRILTGRPTGKVVVKVD